MKIKRILLFYKKSVYRNYFIDKKSSLRGRRNLIPKAHLKRLQAVHKTHYETLQAVEESLKKCGVAYHKKSRGQKIDFKKYDLIITIGGDGTFLEASRHLKKQILLGVNSDPSTSVGSYCVATRKTFAYYLERALNNKAKLVQISRLRVQGQARNKRVDILNDVLIAHKNPAAMSRYQIQIGSLKEEQRSSGVWVSTAAGSTGAMHSAGGKVLSFSGQNFQYRPRELFDGFDCKYRLNGGVLQKRSSVKFISLMREGMIFLDGARAQWPFPFGDTVTIRRSPEFLTVVRG